MHVRQGTRAIVSLALVILAACGPKTEDVPTLRSGKGPQAEPTAVVDTLDDEAKVMAFTQCLRDQGIEVLDPVVDADGNVQKPEPAEGIEVSKEQWIAAMETCDEMIEGVTWTKKRVDRSAQVDHWYQIATCLNEKGYDVGEPTAESIDLWLGDLKAQLDWDNPDVMRVWEECNENMSNQTGKK